MYNAEQKKGKINFIFLNENDFNFLFLVQSTEKEEPTTIFSSIYVESFGNIEEANMVCFQRFLS